MLSSFSRVPELASSQELLEKVPLLLKVCSAQPLWLDDNLKAGQVALSRALILCQVLTRPYTMQALSRGQTHYQVALCLSSLECLPDRMDTGLHWCHPRWCHCYS